MQLSLIGKYKDHKISLLSCGGVWLLNLLLWAVFSIAKYPAGYLYSLSVLVSGSFAYLVYLSIKKCGFPSLETLFLGCLFLFSLSRPFLYVLGIFDFMNGSFAAFSTFAWEPKVAATVLNSYLIFLWVFCLYLEFHEKKRYNITRKPFAAGTYVRVLFYLAFALSAPILSVYYLRQAAVVNSLGYESLYNGTAEAAFNPGMLFSLVRLAFTVCYFGICMLENREKQFTIASIAYLAVTGIQLLQGSRLEFIVAVLFFLYMRFRLFKKRVPLLLAGILLVAGIFGIYAVACLRSGGLSTFTVGGALEYFFVSMSGSINVPAYYLQNKEALSFNTYPYVLEPIVRLFQIIRYPELAGGQSLEVIAHRFSLSHQITYHISEAYYLSGAGVGSNFLAELLEFGIPGVLIGSYVLVKLISLLDENIGRSYFLRFMGSAFVGKILITPRAELFYDTYNLFKYGSIFLVIYLFGCFFYRRTINVTKSIEEKFDFHKHFALFDHGIQNRLLFGASPFTKARNLKICLYYLLIAIFSPCKKGNPGSVYFIAGKGERNWKFEAEENADVKLYRGFCYNSFRELWQLYTVFSPFNRFERFAILVNMISVYLKNKKDVQYLSAWLEYSAYNCFFQRTKLHTFTARNHFDEFATWFGSFAQMYEFRFCVYQHGVVYDSVVLPHKIHCDHFYAFDNYSIGAFRKCYHGNPECQYEVYPFGSSVAFEEIQREPGKLYIGIAEQRNPKWTEQVIALTQKIPFAQVFVMMHPLSDANYNAENISLEKSRKILNLDLLITENSTLALDYYRAYPQIRVAFTSELIRNCFADYPFTYVQSFEEMEKLLNTVAKENGHA